MMLFLLSLGVAEENWNDASQKGMLRYARALSLDVRGKIPTPQELLII